MEEQAKPTIEETSSHKSLGRRALDVISNLRSAYGKLGSTDKVAAIASLVLVVSELLPWYRGKLDIEVQNVKVRSIIAEHSAIGTFSPIEIALLLTAAFVLFLLFARAEGHALPLPISDGTVIAGAGVWAIFLIVFRSFDRPEISFEGASVEMELRWGVLVALIAAITLALTGLSKRRASRNPD